MEGFFLCSRPSAYPDFKFFFGFLFDIGKIKGDVHRKLPDIYILSLALKLICSGFRSHIYKLALTRLTRSTIWLILAAKGRIYMDIACNNPYFE